MLFDSHFFASSHSKLESDTNWQL